MNMYVCVAEYRDLSVCGGGRLWVLRTNVCSFLNNKLLDDLKKKQQNKTKKPPENGNGNGAIKP